MERGRIVAAVTLVLAVVALGTVAGGLSSDRVEGGERSPGAGQGSGEGSLIGERSGVGFDFQDPHESGLPYTIGLALLMGVLWISVALSLAYFAAFLWRSTVAALIEGAYWLARRIAIAAVAAVIIVVGLLALAGLFDSGGGGFVGSTVDAGMNLASDTVITASTNVVPAVVTILGAVLVVIVLATLFSRGEDEDGGSVSIEAPTDGDEPERPPPLGDTGTANDHPAANEVYRAWLRLEERVGGVDHSASPADIERRALDAGLNERTVTELRAMFDAVRYGNIEVTSEHERRARELSSPLCDESSGKQLDH